MEYANVSNQHVVYCKSTQCYVSVRSCYQAQGWSLAAWQVSKSSDKVLRQGK